MQNSDFTLEVLIAVGLGGGPWNHIFFNILGVQPFVFLPLRTVWAHPAFASPGSSMGCIASDQ